MNSTTASTADGLEQLNDSGISDQDDLSETEQSPYFYCCQCKKSNFISRDDYECHLKSHVRLPKIIIQPLKRSVVANIKAKRFGTVKRKSVALKHIRSYIVPQSKNNPLKLTIKLASEPKRKERSFEVVTPKVLTGPGEQYSISVGGVNCVKIEDLLPESENKAAGVEGSSENTEATAAPAEENEKGVQGQEGGNGEIEEGTGASEDQRSNSPQSENPPNDTEFEPATGSFSPNMVEVNGASLADSASQSPGFPTSSPNPPESEQHQSSQFEEDNGTQNSNLDSDQSTLCNETSAGLLNEDSQHSNSAFAWNDVTAASLETMGGDGIGSTPLEERDPLMLPSQSQPAMGQNEPTSILGLGGPSDGDQALDGNESMLRGFLCEQTTDKSAVPVSSVGNIEGLGLGTEYISLERLGEGSGNVLYCDVCGEQASSPASLEEHRTRACHFKCTHSDCGGMVFLTSDELLSHQNAMHGGPPPPYHIPHHQVPPAPVQQLAQQVQRLPVPMSHQPQLHNILSQSQSSQQFVQQQVASPTRRPPPPLYRGPSPSQQQYTAQHVLYGQQPNQQYQQAQQYSSPPLTAQQQNQQQRAYNVISQQQNQRVTITQRGPTVAGISPRQVSPAMKRVAPVAVGGRGSPNSKQRRLDVLIPDRHDDADCHVIAMQKRTESGPIIGNVQSAANNRPESMIHLTDSITLSVRQNQGSGANGNQTVSARGKSDAKAVANILATRGITVTPAGDMVRSAGQSQQQQSTPVRQVARAAPAVPQQVPTLNLNAAISIIRTDGGRQRQRNQQVNQAGGFAVPQGRSPGRPQVAAVERPPRPPTVDLTGDGPAPVSHSLPTRVRGRGRGMANSGRFTCQVCDKIFSSQETLSQHMNIAHRSPNKLPYRCNLCSAQYPTQQGLTQHKQTFHKESGSELVLPVVDMKQPGVLGRLANLGVNYYVPLSQLNSSGGYFGLPLVTVDANGRTPLLGTQAMGASNCLSLGPLRQLPR